MEQETEPLEIGLAHALARPEAYPQDPDATSGVEHVQTHLSHVYLTATRVYKLRKAVALGFVTFSSRAQRNADCLAELTLNRRLSPDVYLGIAPVVRRGDDFAIGPFEHSPHVLDAAAEHCVVMRRLPRGRDAESLLARGQLCAAQIDRIAVALAAFHREVALGVPAPFAAREWLDAIAAPVRANFTSLAQASPSVEALADFERRSEEVLSRLAPVFERRRLEGRAVEGHGDLHLQHVWFVDDDAPPLVIDCLEFDATLRRIDVASEVAFLAMDLRYHGADGFAERLLSRYAAETDDYGLYAVVDFFIGYRAAVRAKVAAIAAADDVIDPDQRTREREKAIRYLELAHEALAVRRQGAFVLVGGAVGTGKSTVARRLADEAGGVVIASDRVRKALVGLAPTDRPRAESGLYAPALRDRVYDALLERAAAVVDSGRIALLDATWAQGAQRARARGFAAARGVPCGFVEARCAEDLVIARLTEREARDDDPSDAGPDLIRQRVVAFEPLEGWLAKEHVIVHTDEPDWEASLARRVEPLGLFAETRDVGTQGGSNS